MKNEFEKEQKRALSESQKHGISNFYERKLNFYAERIKFLIDRVLTLEKENRELLKKIEAMS